MQKILLVEDQPDYQLMVKALVQDRYLLEIAPSAVEAMNLARQGRYDLVLLDVGLPDGNGLELVETIKSLPGYQDLPVVFLTGRSELSDRVAAFARGADDYIVKPFEPLELLARLDAKIRAKVQREKSEVALQIGSLTLDRQRYRAYVIEASTGKRTDLGLTPHEFLLLHYFGSQEGVAISRDQLLDVVWGQDVHVLERTIDRHISSLRKKLPKDLRIQAIPGMGYRLEIVSSTVSAESGT